MSNSFVVIMAGGIGSRFWPQSRTSFPKQFLDILNCGRTLIQMTWDRSLALCPPEQIFVVTSQDYVPLVRQQLSDIPEENILAEPVRRNTAPCIAYAAMRIYKTNPEANMLIMPSDHLILQPEKFEAVIRKSLSFTETNPVLLTLGIKPTRPSTGYGYIQYDEQTEQEGSYRVKTFTEKPSLDIAKTFLKSGDFLWNSGMFAWRASVILEALRKHLPEVMDAFRGWEKSMLSDKESAFVRDAYSQVTNISIDYGVMEKAENVFTIPAQFGWSDIGSWESLYEVFDKDYLENAVAGQQVKIYNASGNMISATNPGKLYVIQGLEGYCLIDTPDVLLICKRENEQEIKQITVDLKIQDLDTYL